VHAGLQQLSSLQQLELLDVPCNDPLAVARLAAQLPCLCDLDLRCTFAAQWNTGTSGQQLSLAAAEALTHLRLHVSPADADTVRHVQWPPQLQVLTSLLYGYLSYLWHWTSCCVGACAPAERSLIVHTTAQSSFIRSSERVKVLVCQALDVMVLLDVTLRGEAIMSLISALPLQVRLRPACVEA
jgi:hypothetical protein